MNLPVVGVPGVFHGQGPVDGPDLHVNVPSDVLFEELLGQVLLQGHGLSDSHPDEDQAPVGAGRVVAGFELGLELGLGTVGESRDALTRAVEGVAVIGAGDVALELPVPLAGAYSSGKEGPPVGTGVGQGRHFVVGVPEEDYLLPQQSQGHRLAPDLLVLHRRVPVFPVTQDGHVVVHADARGPPGDVADTSVIGTAVGVIAVGLSLYHFQRSWLFMSCLLAFYPQLSSEVHRKQPVTAELYSMPGCYSCGRRKSNEIRGQKWLRWSGASTSSRISRTTAKPVPLPAAPCWSRLGTSRGIDRWENLRAGTSRCGGNRL